MKGGGGGKEGRLQLRAPQKEAATNVPAQLGWSQGGCPSLGGRQRPAPPAPSRWPEPSSPQPTEHRVGTGESRRCVCGGGGGVLEERADARLSRYPPYPNGATARWPCLAEGLQCGRGRGAGWSLGPRLRFQPWQTDRGMRARELMKTPSCGGLK